MPSKGSANSARSAVVAVLLCALATAAHAEEPQVERLTLAQVIALVRDNPRARLAREETAIRRAQMREASAARWTKVDMQGWVAPSPEIECANADCSRTSNSEVQLRVGGLFTGFKLEVAQPLFTFGKLDAVSKAARTATEASTHLEDAVMGDQAVDAARAYYGVKLARELRWMLEDGLERIDKAQKRLEKNLEEGSADVTVQDRLRIQTLRAEVEARLTESREAEAVALSSLRALVGRASADVDEEVLDPVATQLGDSSERYLDQADGSHPELAAARAGVAAARALAELESSRLWPDLLVAGRLNLSYAQGTDNPPSAFANDPFNARGFGGALVLRWNIDPMVQLARRARASAEASRAGALADAAKLKMTVDVEKALAEARAARDRIAASRDGERAARGWVAAVLQADAVGAAEAKEIADAYIAYFGARARLLQSTFDFNIATTRLRRATGGFSSHRKHP